MVGKEKKRVRRGGRVWKHLKGVNYWNDDRGKSFETGEEGEKS